MFTENFMIFKVNTPPSESTIKLFPQSGSAEAFKAENYEHIRRSEENIDLVRASFVDELKMFISQHFNKLVLVYSAK